MTSTKRWVQMGQGSFIKWDTPGMEIEGRWAGTATTGKYPNGVLDTTEGRISFPFNTALKDLEKLPLGTEVKIHFLGKRKNKEGTEYNAFTCSVAQIDAPAPDNIPDDDPEVPF